MPLSEGTTAPKPNYKPNRILTRAELDAFRTVVEQDEVWRNFFQTELMTGCVSEINDHLFEGRYSPKWPDGKKHARNVYAHTREECEEKLKALTVEMKAELAELKRWKADRH